LSEDFIVIDDFASAAGRNEGGDDKHHSCPDAEVLQAGLHILNYAFSTEVLYEGILSVLTKIVPFSDAAILMPTKDGGLTTAVTHAGKLDIQLEALEGIFVDVLQGEAILTPDLNHLEGWEKASCNSSTTFGAGLMMALASGDEPAVIVCVHSEPVFNDTHLRALKTFAPLASQAVQWAKQRQEMEQHRHHLEELVRDRTQELGEQKERLAEALQQQLELSGLQRQFVSMVCHEFRTPLAIIDGSAQQVSRRHDSIKPERLLGNVGKIRNAVVRLTNLIESVLDSARLEAGKLKFEPQTFTLSTLIEEACNNHRELNPGYEIVAEIDGSAGDIHADMAQLRQVISNMVANAVTYSPEGTQVWVRAAAADDDQVLISVCDDGVGIPEAELPKLFDRFFRGSTSTGIVGTGIGLHLVKSLVDIHGGLIDVESTVDKGTVFHVTLPRTCQDQAARDSCVAESAA